MALQKFFTAFSAEISGGSRPRCTMSSSVSMAR